MNRWTVAAVVATLVCVAVWFVPRAEHDPVGGRLSYVQFSAALAVTAIWLAVVVVAVSPRNMRRTVGFRAAAVLLGLVVALGMCEFGAWVLPGKLQDNPWYMSTGEALTRHSDLPWIRPPYLHWTGRSRGDLAMPTNSRDPYAREVTFQTDFEGFRNSRDLAQVDMIFIGDSFTEAGNVPEEETFVCRVAESLGVEARNLGMAGYTPPTELIVLRQFGLPCQPHTVVWQIAETNDLDDAVRFYQWVQAGRPNVLPGFTQGNKRSEVWKRRSPSYRLFDWFSPRPAWPLSGEFEDTEGAQPIVRFELALPAPVHGHPGWPLIQDALTIGAETLREQNIQLIVVLIPDKLPVMAPFTDFHRSDLRVYGQPWVVHHDLPSDWDLAPDARLAASLQKHCDRLNVPFVDATTRLTEHASAGELVYLPMDTHLSARGHEIVAQTIVEVLEKLNAE